MTVDEHGATATLPLRAAAVLDGANSEVIAERVEQRQLRARIIGRDNDVVTVESELDGAGRQEKLCPQPQVREAFGLVMAKPDCSSVSL